MDAEGNVHQFTNTNDGTWHWSGSTGDKTVPMKKSDVPNSVKKRIRPTENGDKYDFW
jgi:filamentous hemagglutinin